MFKLSKETLQNIVIKPNSYVEYEKIWLILFAYLDSPTIQLREFDYKNWPYIFTNDKGPHGTKVLREDKRLMTLQELEQY